MDESNDFFQSLSRYASSINALYNCERGEVTIEVNSEQLMGLMLHLRDAEEFRFEQLIDLAGMDYKGFGCTEWQTESATSGGFSRGFEARTFGRFKFDDVPLDEFEGMRYAVVYHLLSITHNQRVRVKCYCADNHFPILPSMIPVWASANWYEREAFDLFGILFDGHPDLRRLLTDYGFIGHPMRKDFPLVGHVEMRYDPVEQRVIYEPVSIEPRVLVPKVIRVDSRYLDGGDGGDS